MMVVYFHIFHSAIMRSVGENPIYQKLADLSDNAASVECFFIISGYFLFISISRNPSETFFHFSMKRAFRLGPVLLFYSIIGVLFFSSPLMSSILNVAFLQCIGLTENYKGINWFISPLFWANLFYFAVLKYFDKNKAAVFIAVLVYFSYLSCVTTVFGRTTVLGIVNLGLARALAGIGLGYLLGLTLSKINHCHLSINHQSRIWRLFVFLFVTFLELASASYLVYCFLLGGEYESRFVVVVIFTILFVCFLYQRGLLSRALNLKIFAPLGRYSYSIYVMQQISFYLLMRSLWKTALIDHVALCILVSLLFSVIIGIATYYLVEKPCMKLFDKISFDQLKESE